jgi:hypothetical protein
MLFDGRFEIVMGVGSREGSTHGFGHKRTVLNDMFERSAVRSDCQETYFSFILSKDSSS